MKSDSWNNNDNKPLFDTLSIDSFKEISQRIGLANCCDLKLLDTYLDNAHTILDVGAGWGRALNYILSRNISSQQVFAIERSDLFMSYLEKHYGEKVNLLHGDVKSLSLPNVGLILWLWAGIAEFTPQEQSQVFAKLSSALNPLGYFIIDTNPFFNVPNSKSKLQVRHFEGQFGVVQEPLSQTLYYYYMPHINELIKYAKMAEINYIKTIPYKTDMGLERALHIFQK